MACQSRCEIRVQASRRRLLTVCSKLSTPPNRPVWGLGCRSAGQLSKRITDDCGRARTCPAAPAFNSPCRRSQTLRRDAALVSRPKEQATRPRVLLWVKLGSPEVQPGGLLCPRKQTSSDQPVRSGSRRVDIEARAFEEEPCFEDASGQTCNRVREAAMWAASLHTLMLPHRRLPPSSGLI